MYNLLKRSKNKKNTLIKLRKGDIKLHVRKSKEDGAEYSTRLYDEYMKKKKMASPIQISKKAVDILSNNKLNVYSEFNVEDEINKDEEGNLIACADSRWCYFDTEAGRPIRIPQSEIDAYGIEEGLEMEKAPRHIRLPKENIVEKMPFKVRTIHLDSNGHVNNEQYINMALAYLPAGIKARELRVEYLRQARLGDMLSPKFYHDGEEYIIWLEIEGQVCAIMQFIISDMDIKLPRKLESPDALPKQSPKPALLR